MLKINKLKVAVVLSGVQKLPEKSYASIQQIANCYKTNIFCHCWEHEPENDSYSFGKSKLFPIPLCTEKEFLDKFKNIKYKISKNSTYKEYFDSLYNQIKNKNGRPTSAFFSQFFSMNTADKLRREYEEKNNMKFDIVMRMRFDIDIKKPLIFENFDLNKINIPDNCGYDFAEIPKPGWYKGINDQFAFGPSNLMTYYFDVYEKMIEIANKGNTYFCTHAILAQHLLNGKIPVNRTHMLITTHGG